MPNDLDHILSEGQCLGNEQIRRYLEGDPEVQRTVEKHLVDCELCNAAVEGFAAVPAFAAIPEMNKQIHAASSTSASTSWGLVAGIGGGLALVASVLLLLFLKPEDTPTENNAPLVETPVQPAVPPKKQLPKEMAQDQPEQHLPELLSKTIAEQPEVTTNAEEVERMVQGPGPEKVVIKRTTKLPNATSDEEGRVKRPKVWSNVHVAFVHDLVVVDYGKILSAGVNTVEEHQGSLHPRYENKQDRTIITFEPTVYTVPYLDYMDEAMRGFAHGNPASTLAHLKHLLTQHHDDVNALFYSGLCLYHLGKPTEAIEHFDQAIAASINTFYEEARWYKALSLDAKGDNVAAKTLMEEIAEEGGFYAERAQERLGQ